MKNLCLFDLDGTLIDPYTAITKGVQHAIHAMGFDAPDRNVLTRFIGPPLRDSLWEINPEFTDKDIEDIVVKYREYFIEYGIYENHLYPGVIEMLSSLKAAGLPLSIATSKWKVSAQKITEYLKIDHYFDYIIGCEADGTRGRKAEVISHVLSLYGHESSENIGNENSLKPIMIGDTKYDIIGARETNVPCIGITWGYGSKEELQAEEPWLIVDTMNELCDALMGLSR